MSRDIAERSRAADAARRAVIRGLGDLAAEGVIDGPDKPWLIKDVPAHTRRELNLYAIARGVTTAKALEEIVAGYLGLPLPGDDDQPEVANAAAEDESEES